MLSKVKSMWAPFILVNLFAVVPSLKFKFMGAFIITTEDLMEFKTELLEDISIVTGPTWLQSSEMDQVQ